MTFLEIYNKKPLLKNMKACCQALGHSIAADSNSSFLSYGPLHDSCHKFAWQREVARVSIATSFITLHGVCIVIK